MGRAGACRHLASSIIVSIVYHKADAACLDSWVSLNFYSAIGNREEKLSEE
jgi:hypothetical protein